jgi:hypothetical protein
MSAISSPDRRRTILCGVVLAAAFALFAALSWRAWPDILVDFGEELYIPWRLTQGEVLYRDVVFLGGPLSLHLHALLFRLFGVSLTTVIGANLGVLAAITAMLWWIFRRSGTHWSATMVAIFFLAVFAFGQYGLIANYNYVCPYRHEVTHGLALGLADLVCLIRYRETRRMRWLLGAGWFLGLVLLTKVEMALAACLATAVALLIVARAGIQPRESPGANDPLISSFRGTGPPDGVRRRFLAIGQALRDLAAVTIPLTMAAAAPVAIAVAALSVPLGWNAAWRGAFATYRLALSPAVAVKSEFYRAAGGWNDPAGNLAAMVLFAGLIAAVLIASFVAEFVLGGRKWSRVYGVLLGLGACWSSLYFIPLNAQQAGSLTINWFDLPCAFPLLLSGVTIALVRRELQQPSLRAFPLCLAAVYALGLLPKIVLRAGWSHYGFALTMPAALVLVHVAVYSLPNWVAGKNGSAACFRGVLIGLAAACALVRVSNWVRIDRFKTQPVGAGADRFYVNPDPAQDERSAPTLKALAYLKMAMRDDQTLVVFPNGTMLNYLLRKRNPTPYQMFTPFEFDIYGEVAVAGAVIHAAPDWVVLVTTDMSEFGRGNFGDPKYAAQIRRFLDEEYEIADTQTAGPYAIRRFSATVFRRRSPRD